MKLLKTLVSSALRKFPATPFFDQIYSLPHFWAAHKRLPRRNSGLFNDYLYFLKAHSHEDPALRLRQRLTDKQQAKEYCKKVLGRDIAPRTFAIFETPDQISDDIAFESCIIKPAHLGGGLVIFHEGGRLNTDRVAEIKGWFKQDAYRDGNRTPNYIGVRPRVICEEVLAGPREIQDYKIYCYEGRPRVIELDTERYTELRKRLYTPEWIPLPYKYNRPLADPQPPPELLDEMLEAAGKLADPFHFIRVDFYQTPGRLWFGEFGNYPAAAHGRFESLEAERAFSEMVFADAR